jgi:hypothetical protein
MSRLTAFAVLVLSLGVAALALPALAEACSCAGPGSEEEIAPFYAQRLKDSDGAIVARVIKVRHTGESTPGSLGDDEAIFTVRVRKAYKRLGTFPEGRRVRVHTASNGATCGLELGRGAVAGLFLSRNDGEWSGNLCGQISPRWMRRAANYDGPMPETTSAGCSGAAAVAA